MVLGRRTSLLHLTISSQKYLVENLAYGNMLRCQVLFSIGIQTHNFNMLLQASLPVTTYACTKHKTCE